MASKLTDISEQRKGLEADFLSRKAVEWFKQQVKSIRSPEREAMNILAEPQRTGRFQLGGMYFFFYDAKTKDKLPYYDIFPLVIPLEKYTDGFLGLNLHYLPIRIRAAFLDKLMDYAVTEGDDIIKMRVTYDILNASKRFKEFKP